MDVVYLRSFVKPWTDAVNARLFITAVKHVKNGIGTMENTDTNVHNHDRCRSMMISLEITTCYFLLSLLIRNYFQYEWSLGVFVCKLGTEIPADFVDVVFFHFCSSTGSLLYVNLGILSTDRCFSHQIAFLHDIYREVIKSY